MRAGFYQNICHVEVQFYTTRRTAHNKCSRIGIMLIFLFGFKSRSVRSSFNTADVVMTSIWRLLQKQFRSTPASFELKCKLGRFSRSVSGTLREESSGVQQRAKTTGTADLTHIRSAISWFAGAVTASILPLSDQNGMPRALGDKKNIIPGPRGRPIQF